MSIICISNPYIHLKGTTCISYPPFQIGSSPIIPQCLYYIGNTIWIFCVILFGRDILFMLTLLCLLVSAIAALHCAFSHRTLRMEEWSKQFIKNELIYL